MRALPEGAVILQVVPALGSGGVEQGTVEMVRAIVAAGGRAVVASAGGRMVAAVEAAGGRHVQMPLASKNPVGIWRNAGLLAGLIRAEGVRLVHARSRAPAWSALLAARRTGVRFMTTFHAPYAENVPGKRAYNAVMAKGERVIAISRFIADLVQERYRVRSGTIRMIPRGVDPVRFDPGAVTPERIAGLRGQWGVAPGVRVVLLPGRLSRWKGHGTLIEALRWSRAAGVVAVFAGPLEGREGYAGQLRRQAEGFGVAERIRFVGEVDDMPAALALADLVVNPSSEPEGFGRTVIEAQAMARPVIAADHGGAVETVAHGVTGWRVTPLHPVALAAAMDRVLAMPAAEVAEVGAAARRSVLRRYTTEAMQAATLAVYGELLG